MTCALCKDAPLTHGHVVTIIPKALNVNLDDFTHVVECSYFTKQAFVRGEVIDSAFRSILAWSRSCWRCLACPQPIAADAIEEEDENKVKEEEEKEPQAGEPHTTVHVPQGDASGSSSSQSHLLEQILENQRAMQHQLNGMET